MHKLVSYDIVFQEIPGEVTLALNLSRCPNRCPGCHSPHLREDIGEVLDDRLLCGLVERYGNSVTCVCFMGGDADTGEVARLAGVVKEQTGGKLKTAWYSGLAEIPKDCGSGSLDFIKVGPWIESLGGLDSQTTNQRLYRIRNGRPEDMTECFRRTRKSG